MDITTTPPAPVLGFLAVHAGLRRDAAALAAAARSGTPCVGRRLALLDRVLRAHHHGEDRVLLPLLRSKEPSLAGVADRVEAQHAELDHALDGLRAGVAERRPVAAACDGLAALVEAHLALEETELLPVWVASLSGADHERFARRLRRATPWRDVAVVVPWLLDVVPDDVRPIAETELPGSVRFAYRHALRSRFERRWRPATPSP